MGGAYRIPSAEESNAVAKCLADSAERFNAVVDAGICYDTRQYPHLQPKLIWRDDTVILPCIARAGNGPVFAIGRRMAWEPGDNFPKYLMGSCTRGAYRAPYGLPSLRAAADAGDPLYILEGATDALAAETLGHRAIAMLGRPCAINDTDERSTGVQQLTYVLDDLRRCREVIVVSDKDLSPKSTETGVRLAARLASWLRARGVNGVNRTMDDLSYGEYKDLALVTEARAKINQYNTGNE
jgi:hypothetical protein